MTTILISVGEKGWRSKMVDISIGAEEGCDEDASPWSPGA